MVIEKIKLRQPIIHEGAEPGIGDYCETYTTIEVVKYDDKPVRFCSLAKEYANGSNSDRCELTIWWYNVEELISELTDALDIEKFEKYRGK